MLYSVIILGKGGADDCAALREDVRGQHGENAAGGALPSDLIVQTPGGVDIGWCLSAV
jgi:hypothetical protein